MSSSSKTPEYGLTGMAAMEAEMRDRLADKNAEIDRLRSENERMRKALEEAVRLFDNYGLVARQLPNDPMAAGRWINEARAALQGDQQ